MDPRFRGDDDGGSVNGDLGGGDDDRENGNDDLGGGDDDGGSVNGDIGGGDDDRENGDDDLGGGNFFGEPDSPKLLAQWVRGAWCRGDIHGALGISWRPWNLMAPGKGLGARKLQKKPSSPAPTGDPESLWRGPWIPAFAGMTMEGV